METEMVKLMKIEKNEVTTNKSDDDDDNSDENNKLIANNSSDSNINSDSMDRLSIKSSGGGSGNGDCSVCTNKSENRKRPDEPTELCFEKFPECEEEKQKRKQIENALTSKLTTLEQWRDFATSEYGLINDDLRRQVWPLLVEINPNDVEPAPTLDELKGHPEYNQVVLDVNRSLKRFPPGIPYDQRVALQDQLTVLILRVIMKYPHLKYYQGYHDVAVTFLLVVGEEVAFHVMEILSTNHLVECMQETMEPTQRRLMFLFPIIRHENPKLCDYIEKSSVQTLFALPWYLTWFGHSLNQYRSVVRLYDYFLASPFLLPLYVTAAIVLYREDDIFAEECDMASMHCVLSQLPDNLPFEYLLVKATELYAKYPPDTIESDVDEMVVREKQKRIRDDEEAAKRRLEYQRRKALQNRPASSIVEKFIPNMLMTRRSVIVTTAFSIFVGFCAYYYKYQLLNVGIR